MNRLENINGTSVELPVTAAKVKRARKARAPKVAPVAPTAPAHEVVPIASRWARARELAARFGYPAACFGLASGFLGISLPHLADGVAAIVAAGPIAKWIMAACMDLSQVAAEIGIITGRGDRGLCKHVVRACTALSAVLNVIHFTEHSQAIAGVPGLASALAVVFGILFPIGVLTMSHLGADALMRRND